MNSKSIRRLAADHGSLHTAGLPPNYLWPSTGGDPTSDLTSLDVLLSGPTGTPYSGGVWRLHLEIPTTYPQSPPTATFRTRLWHPNIDEATGAVCVETLKRDWSSTLKLRDVLVTISCLLIQPNPASALNEAAGKLASEDWDGFCRRAKLMTDIHAAIPTNIAAEVKEAQMRGEDPVVKEVESEVIEATGKGKEKVVDAAKEVEALVASDTENRVRRSATVEVSDDDSEWIPRPATLVNDAMEVEAHTKESMAKDAKAKDTTVSSQTFNNSFSLRNVPPSATLTDEPRVGLPANFFKVTADDLARAELPLSHPENQIKSLLSEFSWSWAESEVMKETGTIKDGSTKDEVRKRLASLDFEKKSKWEMKKFKNAGYDLKRYNRGDWGPKTGIFRL